MKECVWGRERVARNRQKERETKSMRENERESEINRKRE